MLMLYAKGPNDTRYNAIGSLKKLTYAPNLMHAVLFPEDKLPRLKEYCQELLKYDPLVLWQVRTAGTDQVVFKTDNH